MIKGKRNSRGKRTQKSTKKITPKTKKTKSADRLSQSADKIKKKQVADPYYIISKYERKTLQKWATRQERVRLAAIKEEKKKLSAVNNSMKKRRKISTTIPRTTQQTLPYIADYEEGLFEVEPNKYSKVFAINDINYLIAGIEEQTGIFCKYGEFLNYFSEDINFAICIDNRVVSMTEMERKILYPLKNDDYDKHRQEYNKILKRQIVTGRNNIIQSKYITVTIDCDSPYEAILEFHKIQTEVILNLKKIGSDAYVLTTDERLAMLHDKFRKGREGEFKIDYDFIKTQGISSKDYIAPSSFRFEKKYFMIEDEYYACLYLNNLPASLSDEFFNQLVDCEFPMTATINIQPVAQDKALRIVKRQLTSMEANKIEAEKKAVRSGYSPETISHDLKQSLSQAEELLDDLINKNQKMFFVTISFMVNGRTIEELNENCNIILSKARKYTCQLQYFDWQQEDAFKVTLPVGIPPRRISVERTLTTESTSIFMPFSSQDLFQEGGCHYGINQINRNLVICNKVLMLTASGFVLGSTGSGKSFAVKKEILNELLKNEKTVILVIDPDNEYSDFAKAFGGTVIKISSDSTNYINPMDMSLDYGLDENDKETDMIGKKDKALRRKSDYIMSIIERMISVGKGESNITPQQKTIVDRCVRKCYQEYLDNDFDDKYLPTLLDLQNLLDKEKKNSKDANLMAEGVEYYTKGSMNVFSHKSNIEYDNRFVVFNIRELGNQLKDIGLLIVLDFIWNRMTINSKMGVRTCCKVDEIHTLFNHGYSAEFIRQLYKRGRKYGLEVTGITQNIEDLLKSDVARGMVGNSEFLLILKQAPEDLKLLAPMLRMSDAQMAYVSQAETGSGLLKAGDTIVPFLDQFPKESYLYDLISTKFGEERKSKSSSQ